MLELDHHAQDESHMRQALAAARRSAEQGEVPVGAVLIRRRAVAGADAAVELLACSHNQPIRLCDPTAHAEVLALREAARQLGNYRLDDCDLYVTLEPCAMCAQAMLHARIRRVVYGAREPRTGAAGSVIDLFAIPGLNHHTEVVGGVLAEECAALMSDFFTRRRAQARQVAVPLHQDALRTPEHRFASAWEQFPDLRGFSGYELGLPELQGLRLHGIDIGPADAPVAWLALHGPDGWWPQLAAWALERARAGERVLLPDLIGFGQSDKPKKSQWHALEWHARLLLAWIRLRSCSKINVTYAKNQSMLAKMIEKMGDGLVQACQALPASAQERLPDTLRNAPYPDAGHRAGGRAWHSQRWDL
jgi:tRNA(Arg) A34 adenosine deaminase TadA